MPVQHIDLRKHIPAEPATVWALLRDGAGWPTWSPITSFALESPGNDEPEGLGAIRVFRTRRTTGTITSRERIVELVPDRRFSYELVSGMPLRGYRAVIDLEPADGGTALHWHSSFRASVPGTGWLYRRVLGGFIGQVVDGLAARAASEPTSAGPSTPPDEQP